MAAHVTQATDSRALNPQTAITIAVDTAYVAAQAGKNIFQGGGVYMMDNRLPNGSQGEGTLQLSTMSFDGSLVGFNVVPINVLGSSGDTVVITEFNVSQGAVFTAAGQPGPQPSPPGEPAGAYWIGQCLNQGSQTYQIQIKVTVGQLQPVSFYVQWSAMITAS